MLKQFQFKENGSKIKPYPQHLVNVIKDFTIINMKKTVLKGYVHTFLLIMLLLILKILKKFIDI